eukprot:UN24000
MNDAYITLRFREFQLYKKSVISFRLKVSKKSKFSLRSQVSKNQPAFFAIPSIK